MKRAHLIGPPMTHDFADEKLRDLRRRLSAAEAGRTTGNPAVIRDQIDKWLEYRWGLNERREPL
jgi:hypothetical protein